MYIKDFDRFMFSKTKSKNKKHFFKSCLKCFSSKNVLTKHKEVCLKMNGKQAVKLKGGFIEFKNDFKQIPIAFKISDDFWFLQNQQFLHKKYEDHIPCSLSFKVLCADDKFTKPVVVYKGENAAYKFFKAILQEFDYCKKVMKKHFNKHLIMAEEDEENLQSSKTFGYVKNSLKMRK